MESNHLGFTITADGCAWVCADCGKEFPLGDTLHLCEAKLPEEYRKLREQIAALTRERDEEQRGRMLHESLHASWRDRCEEARRERDEAREKHAAMAAKLIGVVEIGNKYFGTDLKASDGARAILAARDARMKREGGLLVLNRLYAWAAGAISASPTHTHPSGVDTFEEIDRRIAALEAEREAKG